MASRPASSELSITDLSKANNSFTTYQSAPQAQRSSAEWIVEAPSDGTRNLPLADFSSVAFASATATINGVTGPIDDDAWQSAQIDMVASNGSVEATVSGLTDTQGTSSFTATFGASANSAAGNLPTAAGTGRVASAAGPVADLKPGLLQPVAASVNSHFAARDQVFASLDHWLSRLN